MLKQIIRKVFQPLIEKIEGSTAPYRYQRSDRVILGAVGLLFTLLGAGATAVALIFGQLGGLLPGMVFLGLGLVCAVVAYVGEDRAVARLWGKVES